MPPGISTFAPVCQFFFTSGSILNKRTAQVPSSTTVKHDEAVLGDVKPVSRPAMDDRCQLRFNAGKHSMEALAIGFGC